MTTKIWKGVWLFVVFLLTAAEIQMIVWSDADSRRERNYEECEMQKNFQEIEKDNQQQFQQTMSSVGQVFDKTKQVAGTATDAAVSPRCGLRESGRETGK